jgi:hypothetical protein
MRKVVGAALVALLFFSLAAASALAGKRTVPARLAQARYVALGYDLGDRFESETAAIADPNVLPEERRALQAIHDEFERWGKYVVVVRPEDAELFIAIRIGRHGSVGGGGIIDSGSTNPFEVGGMRRGGGMGSAEISSNSDMLTVYDSAGGRVGAQLWRVQRGGGLGGEPPKLFQEFRADVERTPEPPKKEPEKKKPE